MTNEEMKKEIERLQQSENVKKARREKSKTEKGRLQQRLYTLRWLEKKGRAMSESKAVN